MPFDLKIAFAGTPELAACILQKLIDEKSYSIKCVFTRADKPAGRGRKLQASPVKELALKNGLSLYQPDQPSEMDEDNILATVDILVVAAYGMLLPEAILKRPRLGAINVHTSLLPRWRGAAPIQRAIQAGDASTGITIMQMDAGLDTGDILLQRECSISADETAGSLHDCLAILGGEVLLDALRGLEQNSLPGRAQNEEMATYAHKISRAEAEIDWTLPAEIIERKIRAFNPYPVAHTTLNGFKMKIWEVERLQSGNTGQQPGTVAAASSSGLDVACENGLIRIHKLQLPGKKKITASEFLNGHQGFPGSC